MSKLRDEDKHAIYNKYASGISQESIAYHFGVSRRTIGRVLRDAGLTAPVITVSPQEQSMVYMLQNYQMTPATLRVLLRMAYPEVKA